MKLRYGPLEYCTVILLVLIARWLWSAEHWAFRDANYSCKMTRGGPFAKRGFAATFFDHAKHVRVGSAPRFDTRFSGIGNQLEPF